MGKATKNYFLVALPYKAHCSDFVPIKQGVSVRDPVGVTY